MKKLVKPLIILLIGIIIGMFISISKSKTNSNSNTKSNIISETRIINHELKKLNKMIVVEQNFSEFKTKKFRDYESYSKYLSFLDKNIVLYITAKAQVSYDMSQLKVELDTINKIISIIQVPDPQLDIFSDVEIYSMENGIFSKFTRDDLKEVINEGKSDITKIINNSGIKDHAKLQLLQNLKELYFFAELYHWKIEDKTPYSKELKDLKS